LIVKLVNLLPVSVQTSIKFVRPECCSRKIGIDSLGPVNLEIAGST